VYGNYSACEGIGGCLSSYSVWRITPKRGRFKRMVLLRCDTRISWKMNDKNEPDHSQCTTHNYWKILDIRNVKLTKTPDRRMPALIKMPIQANHFPFLVWPFFLISLSPESLWSALPPHWCFVWASRCHLWWTGGLLLTPSSYKLRWWCQCWPGRSIHMQN